MATLSDARFDTLRLDGYTGATSDMLLQWLQANGATSPAIPDAWQEMITTYLGIPTENYHRSDSWFELLSQIGYEGSMNDMELEFWLAGGKLPVPGRAFSDGFDTGFG